MEEMEYAPDPQLSSGLDVTFSSDGIHTLSFVPGAGYGDPVDHLDLLRQFQAAGKSVHL